MSSLQTTVFTPALTEDRRFPPKFFVTGTDTGVGKTFVSALLQVGLNAGYWKPIQCGVVPTSDTEWVQTVTGLGRPWFYNERYRLNAPLSPHLASVLENLEIHIDDFSLPARRRDDRLIVEGAGGVMVPINGNETMLDLMDKLALPVLVVTRGSLGTINHTLLTIKALLDRKLNVFGIVMNGERNQDNRKSIEHFSGVPVLGWIERLEEIDSRALKAVFEREFRRFA